MTEAEITRVLTDLPGVAVVVASEEGGAPEVAWGDSFFFYDPDDQPEHRRLPFATIVIKDYPGFDTASDLDRPGVFRLNLAIGRDPFNELFGFPPARSPSAAPSSTSPSLTGSFHIRSTRRRVGSPSSSLARTVKSR